MNNFRKVRNYLGQVLNPNVKVFFIGFNKCGTTALHHMMSSSGINSMHHHFNARATWSKFDLRGRSKGTHSETNIAVVIQNYKSENTPPPIMHRYTAFSDLIYSSADIHIEANQYFWKLYEWFPESYFILNDREENAWLSSRLKHSGGSYLKRCMKLFDTNRDGVVDIWRNNRREHHKKVLDYFEGNEKFLHFKIDTDPVENLAAHLSPAFKIDTGAWRKINQTRSD